MLARWKLSSGLEPTGEEKPQETRATIARSGMTAKCHKDLFF